MKKNFLSLILSGAILFTSAQTSKNTQRGDTTRTSSASKKTKSPKNKTAPLDTLSNRKFYKSKATGQAATPTGHQATGTNGSHSKNPKNAGKNEE